MKITDLNKVNGILAADYAGHKAPIVELTKSRTDDPFHILVTTILSSRTKDETTSEVVHRLFKKVNSTHDLRRIPEKELQKLIYPIGFFRTKAKMLKRLPDVLQKEFGGIIPEGIDDLCRLPGVGRKVANLVRAVAFNKPAICVDVHVHRICNRLGLIKTKTPFETECRLRKILPVKYWITWNAYLVSYGQRICRPIGPKCSTCKIYKYCSRVGVKTKNS